MKSIKGALAVCLILTLIAATGYVAYGRGLIKAPKLLTSNHLGIKALNSKDQLNLEKAFTEASTQIRTLSQRGAETANTSSKVLGDFIEVNEDDSEKSTSEKALEYGRYLYCQQVVADWQKGQ
jgi:hypothetical protein